MADTTYSVGAKFTYDVTGAMASANALAGATGRINDATNRAIGEKMTADRDDTIAD